MNVPIRRLAMTCLTEAASAPEDLVSTSNQPVIVFDKVSLAFDDNVILNEVSFAVVDGRWETTISGQPVGTESP